MVLNPFEEQQFKQGLMLTLKKRWTPGQVKIGTSKNAG
jgi:hypothetical protein